MSSVHFNGAIWPARASSPIWSCGNVKTSGPVPAGPSRRNCSFILVAISTSFTSTLIPVSSSNFAPTSSSHPVFFSSSQTTSFSGYVCIVRLLSSCLRMLLLPGLDHKQRTPLATSMNTISNDNAFFIPTPPNGTLIQFPIEQPFAQIREYPPGIYVWSPGFPDRISINDL